MKQSTGWYSTFLPEQAFDQSPNFRDLYPICKPRFVKLLFKKRRPHAIRSQLHGAIHIFIEKDSAALALERREMRTL
jgi:hypothetical protein